MDQFDRKRIKGPEKSVVPLPFNPAPPSTARAPNTRPDARTKEQVRPLFAKPGIVTQAAGSSLFEVAGIKILAAVWAIRTFRACPQLNTSFRYGPKQITIKQRAFDQHSGGRLSCDVRFAPFSRLARKGYTKETVEITLAKDLATAIVPSLLLEHLPKSQIDLFIEILQATSAAVDLDQVSMDPSLLDSLLLAHCITAASLALADAGLEMMDNVVGCNIGVYRNHLSRRLFWMVDPADNESETSCDGGGSLVGSLSIACMPSVGRVTGLVVYGDIGDVEFLTECMQVCSDVSAKIHEVVVTKALLE
ncbi:Exosome complex component MTR3 [Entophlyctis luteolus]|nr:Exosome complex component MTR3 [Entophlyctis luteolus]KAJ3394919.1 Exosome complex component MTR3 [Entophlyctis sp. JEL0112]